MRAATHRVWKRDKTSDNNQPEENERTTVTYREYIDRSVARAAPEEVPTAVPEALLQTSGRTAIHPIADIGGEPKLTRWFELFAHS